MYALERTDKKLLSTAVFALLLNLIVLHWSSTFVGALPWIILAVGLSILYLPLVLTKKWGIGSYPFIFIVLEEVRNRFPFGGFGWVRIGFTQADSPFSKIAAIGGAPALSATVLLIALFIYFLTLKRFFILALMPLLLIFVPFQLNLDREVSVLMVQGNVPQMGLEFNSRAKAVFKNHFELTQRELSKDSNVDFILWPENSVDVDPFANTDVRKDLDSIPKPLIIGAIVNQDSRILNTSILWKDPDIYVKQHLTPFGEYIPLRPIARIISPYVDRVDDFSPGEKSKTFIIGAARISPVICYELIDDELLTKAAQTANILAVQTNSATFGMSAESAQQLSITRIRAIEHGRNIISVSTTGYSAVIDYQGRVMQQTSMGTAASIRAKVGLIDGQTPRDRAGDWTLAATLIFLWVALVRARVIRR